MAYNIQGNIYRCAVCHTQGDESMFSMKGQITLCWDRPGQRHAEEEQWLCDDDLEMMAQCLRIMVR